MWVGIQISGRERWKLLPNLKKLSFFQGSHWQLFIFCIGRIEAIFLHIVHPNNPSFYLKCPENIKIPIILTFFQRFRKFAPFSLPSFVENPKFNHTPMCVWLKLGYGKVSVSNIFFQKLAKKNHWGGGETARPSLVKEGLKFSKSNHVIQSLRNLEEITHVEIS